MNMNLQEALSQLTEGLLMMSESEYPFEVFEWEATTSFTPEELLKKTGHSLDTPVEVVELDSFFKRATTLEDWYEEEEKKTVYRYQSLLQTLKQNLNNVQVCRVGEREIEVYIIGQASEGHLAGLKTKVIET